MKRTGLSGFTLIELLVTIAIISVLAAILFPVFARARENARRASCSSNVKQMMLGLIQYTQDYDERLPMSWTPIGANRIVWFQAIQPYVKSTQLFVCPSDSSTDIPAWPTKPAPTGFVNPFHCSYVASNQLSPLPAQSVSLAQIESPSTTNTDWAAPSPRHLETSNVGFMDGHVKAMKIKKWYFDDTPWLDPAQGGG